jgi:DNA repair ATPase RecN
MPDELHDKIKALAKEYGTSVNGLINQKMKEFADLNEVLQLEKLVFELEKEVEKLKKQR